MYNGEVNAEKLDNWSHHLDVYCRIQNLQGDDIKIQLISLIMEGATLVWWESKIQEDIKKHIISQFLGMISLLQSKDNSTL